MDDITLLFRRFHDLMATVQGLMDELSIDPSAPALGDESPDHGAKAYTVSAAPNISDETRHRALIQVIDDALSQIKAAAAKESLPRIGGSPPPIHEAHRDIFTVEELRFLETTFRAIYPVPKKRGDTGP